MLGVDHLGRLAVRRIDPLAVDEVRERLHAGILASAPGVGVPLRFADGAFTLTAMTEPAIRSVGVPREVKTAEHRVAMTPDGVRELERHGIQVFVEAGAGDGASISDADYVAAGADIVPTAADAWSQQMVVKVKEPKDDEFAFLRARPHAVHVPPPRRLPRGRQGAGRRRHDRPRLRDGAARRRGAAAAGADERGRRPAGAAEGAHFLERHNGGRGVLMGGAPGVRPAKVVVLGAGNVGWNAAWIAAGMEAEVVLIDKNLDRLRWVDQIHQGRIMTLASNRGAIERSVVRRRPRDRRGARRRRPGAGRRQRGDGEGR